MRLLLLFAFGCHTPDDSAPSAATPEDTAPACQGPDETPEPTREGHPADGWRWQKQGALFPDTEDFGYNEGDMAPTVVDAGGTLHLIFSRQEGSSHELWASDSEDGMTWSVPAPVTGIPEGQGSYPGLVWDGGGYTLYYGSGTIDRAESSDGVAFGASETVLRPSDVGDFGALSLLYPAPVQDGDAVQLYFTGFDGAEFSIGRATYVGTDLSPGEDPVLRHGGPGSWYNTAVAAPAAVHFGERWYLWLGGYDTSVSDPGPWRVGFTQGDDGFRWDTTPTVSLPLGESGADAWSTRDPAVVPWGGGWLMIYVGMGDDGVYRLMAATSDVCG